MDFEIGQDVLFAGPEEQQAPDTLSGLECLPTPEHVDTVFQGAMDTVEGNEGLTYAQHYVHSVMQTSGSISSRTGTEGFFSTLGDGIQKVWEYIKKMFSWIFGGFLRKDSKEKKAKADKDIKDAEASIKSVESPKVTASNVKEVIHKAESKIQSLPESPLKKDIERQIEAIKSHPPTEIVKSVKDVDKLMEGVFKASLVDSPKVKALHDKMESAIVALKAIRAKDPDSSDSISITTFLNGLIGLPDATRDVHDETSAKAFLHKASRCLQAMSNNFMDFTNQESAIKSKVTELEHELGELKKGGERTAVNKKLKHLQGVLSGLALIIQQGNKVTEAISDMAKLIDKACIVII